MERCCLCLKLCCTSSQQKFKNILNCYKALHELAPSSDHIRRLWPQKTQSGCEQSPDVLARYLTFRVLSVHNFFSLQPKLNGLHSLCHYYLVLIVSLFCFFQHYCVVVHTIFFGVTFLLKCNFSLHELNLTLFCEAFFVLN